MPQNNLGKQRQHFIPPTKKQKKQTIKSRITNKELNSKDLKNSKFLNKKFIPHTKQNLYNPYIDNNFIQNQGYKSSNNNNSYNNDIVLKDNFNEKIEEDYDLNYNSNGIDFLNNNYMNINNTPNLNLINNMNSSQIDEDSDQEQHNTNEMFNDEIIINPNYGKKNKDNSGLF